MKGRDRSRGGKRSGQRGERAGVEREEFAQRERIEMREHEHRRGHARRDEAGDVRGDGRGERSREREIDMRSQQGGAEWSAYEGQYGRQQGGYPEPLGRGYAYEDSRFGGSPETPSSSDAQRYDESDMDQHRSRAEMAQGHGRGESMPTYGRSGFGPRQGEGIGDEHGGLGGSFPTSPEAEHFQGQPGPWSPGQQGYERGRMGGRVSTGPGPGAYGGLSGTMYGQRRHFGGGYGGTTSSYRPGADAGYGTGSYGTESYGASGSWTGGVHGGEGGANGGGNRRKKSPKNFQRSDERIKEEVYDRLIQDPDIEIDDIEIEVQAGEVTITGTVPQRWLRYRVEETVDSIWGIKDITNNLRVRREEQAEGEGSGRGGKKSARGKNGETGSDEPRSTGAGRFSSERP